jgi:hypothetical protein
VCVQLLERVCYVHCSTCRSGLGMGFSGTPAQPACWLAALAAPPA